MEISLAIAIRVAGIGVLATVVLDMWLLVLKRAGVPTLDFAMIGRWVGHTRRGVFVHGAIGKAAPVMHERVLGWLFHYLTGIVFAALLVAVKGVEWTANPSFAPAMAVGVTTVLAPWLVMQPAMGAGIAASKTPSPAKNRARSLANHSVFGFGLYAAALILAP
jgi:hypothetical protein